MKTIQYIIVLIFLSQSNLFSQDNFSNHLEQIPLICGEISEDKTAATPFNNHPQTTLINLIQLNSGSLDYCATPFKNGLVFTSTRGANRLFRKIDKKTKGNFSDLFYAERKTFGEYKKPKSMRGEINGKFHDGVASFNDNQSVMFFSRNNLDGKSEDGYKNLKVYEVSNSFNTSWVNAKDLPFNSDEFTSCHPSLSSDAMKLYFSSDRPGGMGGMDLYVSHRMGGSWSEPVNLGPEINSSKNEIFPHIDDQGHLYFASNGHEGIGGLDVFVSQKTDNESEKSWVTPQNLGTPFNSKKDDFGFVMNGSNKHGYITSDRFGGQGGDDIYEWTTPDELDFLMNTSPKTKELSLRVIDAETQQRLQGVKVEIADNKFSNLGTVKFTDKEGVVLLIPQNVRNSKIALNMTAYETLHFDMADAMMESSNKNEITLRLVKRTCSQVNGVVMNKDCHKNMHEASVQIFNKCTGKKETIQTDENGFFDYCLDCACDYSITATKPDFSKDMVELKTVKGNCAMAETIKVNLELSLEKERIQELLVHEVKTALPTKLNTNLGVMEVGKTISLKNIYYDYNKSSIRQDAKQDLDNLISIMKQYPAMEIEMLAHTDSRGGANYNLELSENRAISAARYLIVNGISSYRIQTQGYGETKPLVECIDNSCSEENHLMNRRTEVRITKMNTRGVKVIYNN